MVDAAESNAPWALSPTCSVVDFWESGCMAGSLCQRPGEWDRGYGRRTFIEDWALSVKDCLPVSDMFEDMRWGWLKEVDCCRGDLEVG